MAETKPTATAAKSNASAKPNKSSNFIATIAPIACVIGGYLIWRVLLGSASNFTSPDPDASHWFWPSHKGPKGTFTKMYEGGIVVPILIASFLVVLTFAIERLFVKFNLALPIDRLDAPIPLPWPISHISTPVVFKILQ